MEWFIFIFSVIIGALGYGMLLIASKLLDQAINLLDKEKRDGE